MAVRKRKYSSGRIAWAYTFEAPDSTRENRRQVVGAGFKTKREATDAEAARRLEVRAEYDQARASAARPAALPPKSLKDLVAEFCDQYGVRNLEPKTVERYRQTIEYLAPELLATSCGEVTAFQLTREWNRLQESGGHHRRTKASRPLAAKTIRNFAGVVSSAYSWACSLGLVRDNPVKNSKLPRGRKREAVVLTVDQQKILIEASAHPVLGLLLELSAALGARRGELLALRWSDLRDGRISIGRSLSQTKNGLTFKDPKTARSARTVTVPNSTLKILGIHQSKQKAFREQFGPDYQTDLDLILAHPDGSPFRPDTVSAMTSALCQRLKLPKGTSLHTLRHTHGSHLLAKGMELTAVSKRLGHANTGVTAAVYAHALDGRDEEAARLWEEFQDRGAPGKVQ